MTNKKLAFACSIAATLTIAADAVEFSEIRSATAELLEAVDHDIPYGVLRAELIAGGTYTAQGTEFNLKAYHLAAELLFSDAVAKKDYSELAEQMLLIGWRRAIADNIKEDLADQWRTTKTPQVTVKLTQKSNTINEAKKKEGQ